MKYIYSTSQISKLSLILCTFSVTGSVAGLFLTSGGVWKAVETKAGKVEMAKAEGGGAEGRRRKEARRKGEEKGREKAKKRKKARSMKDSRRMGDLGRRGRGSKIRGRSKEASSGEVP